MAIAGKIKDRIVTGLKHLVPIVQQQKARDVSEADTVTIVKDLLSSVFGYDKYAELTSEHAIRGTYCDLAVKLNDKLVQLIEVKSAGTPLDDRHVKQAVDYASNQGVEWVVLTNASVWRLYQVIFAKPIDKRLILEIDITALDARKEDQLEKLFLFSKEGFTRGAHTELRDRQDATSRYLLAALLIENDSVIAAIRRELRRVVDVLVDDEDVVRVLREEVIKRDNLEGPLAEAANRRCCRHETRTMRKAREPSAATAIATGLDGDAPSTQPET
ncbi:MAG: type restriction enzyme terminus family protein [Phycisphaerales bacterium]|nr:type restriction enzyme terminus family protein [Phycisphaerales bacterium]